MCRCFGGAEWGSGCLNLKLRGRNWGSWRRLKGHGGRTVNGSRE